MIVIFPLLVSKNVNTNLVQGVAVALERYVASQAMSDFVGKNKEFNKFYNYKVKAGKLYSESDSTWFDLDPLTQGILEQNNLTEVSRKARRRKKREAKQSGFSSAPSPSGNQSVIGSSNDPNFKHYKGYNEPDMSQWQNRRQGIDYAADYLTKKGYKTVRGSSKDPNTTEDPTKVSGMSNAEKERKKKLGRAADFIKTADQIAGAFRKNKDEQGKTLPKPGFSSASLSNTSLGLEPTWIKVQNKEGGGESRLGIKVVPMMIEGFNIKHTLSADMKKYFIQSFLTNVSRIVMRKVYRLIDKWTSFGARPRGDIRQDVFYARTGHDGQPFILLDLNEDVPPLFLSQPQNMLKLWKMSWGNLLIADDNIKTVMFCMKKYKGMCSNFTYSMLFAQTKEMAKVFEDMESAKKAMGSIFKFNKKITKAGGR